MRGREREREREREKDLRAITGFPPWRLSLSLSLSLNFTCVSPVSTAATDQSRKTIFELATGSLKYSNTLAQIQGTYSIYLPNLPKQ